MSRPLLAFSVSKLSICRPRAIISLSKRVPLPGARASSTQPALKRVSEAQAADTGHNQSSVALPPKLAVRNILRDCADLLRRIYPDTDGAPWADRAEHAAEDLTQQRRARIAIVGDRLSGARELVTALLEEPLASNGRRRALWSRWDGVDGDVLKITNDDRVALANGSLTLPSDWLARSEAEFCEVITSDPLQHLSFLLTFDTIFLVTDSTRLLHPFLPLLPQLPNNPSAPASLHLIINRTANLTFAYTPQEDDARLHAELEEVYRGAPKPPVSWVSSTLALEALEAFRASATPSPEAVNVFQTKSLASRISLLASSLARPVPPDFQLQTAEKVATGAMEAASFAIVEAEREVEDARGRAGWLRSEAEAETHKWSAVEGLEEQVKGSEAVVKGAIDRFAFWKLPWKVDDVGAEVRETVERTYGRELERKLCYDTGRLQGTQNHVTNLTTQALDCFLPSPNSRTAPFHSPLLHNRIAQLTSLTTLSASSLLHAVYHRRSQLTQTGGPIDHLHLRAQRLVAGAWVTGVGAPFAGYATWFGWGFETSTVLASIGLVWVATAWWCQGRWRKAIQRFWEDWERVGAGLDFDLKRSLDSVLKDKVLAKPLAASEGIQELVCRREKTLTPLKNDLRSLDRRLEEVLRR